MADGFYCAVLWAHIPAKDGEDSILLWLPKKSSGREATCMGTASVCSIVIGDFSARVDLGFRLELCKYIHDSLFCINVIK